MNTRMKWIEKVVRTNGTFELQCVGSDGSRQLTTFRSISRARLSLPFRETRFKQLDIDLRELTTVSPECFLRGIGFRPAVEPGQAVYALNSRGLRFLIPASVLLRALLLVLASLIDVMLRPAAREQAWRVIQVGDRLALQHVPKLIQKYVRQGSGAVNRLIWLSCFPSGRRLWDSVYLHASNGRLDLAMPEARIRASVVGARLGDEVYVSNITVYTVHPSDKPTLFSSLLRRAHLVLSRGDKKKRSSRPRAYRQCLRDAALIQGPAGWKLTDEEWLAVQAASKPIRRLTYRGRHRIDGILEKFGEGASWVQFKCAANAYSQMRKDGSWTLVRAALLRLRQRTCSVSFTG